MHKPILGLVVLLASVPAAAAPLSGHASADILYHFTGGTDGGGPFGGLVRDSQGNLYGTTAAGGIPSCNSPIDAPGCGVVFQLSPPQGGHGAWRETVLYTFMGGTDGNGPLAGLVQDQAGNLYGTTEAGGASTCGAGCGTVFELSPPTQQNPAWSETVLHRFGATGSDGEFPASAPVQDAAGNLYGTTPTGGAAGLGTIYEISPKTGGGWTETILHDFQIGDGAGPIAGLLLAADGALYGTAASGSKGSKICENLDRCGTVFALNPPAPGSQKWNFSVLFRFPAQGQDGLYPMAALVMNAQGRLIGTTENFGLRHGIQANGTVFRLSPPAQPGQMWSLQTLLDFTTIGTYPAAPVLQAGPNTLYGTTEQAGTAKTGNGLVYALTPSTNPNKPWHETALFTFPRLTDGAMPLAGLTPDPDGALYGTTSTAGSTNCSAPFCGTVFRVTPKNTNP